MQSLPHLAVSVTMPLSEKEAKKLPCPGNLKETRSEADSLTMRKHRRQKTPNRLQQPGHLTPASDWSPTVPTSVKIDGRQWPAIGRGITFAVYSDGTEVVKIPLNPQQLLQDWRSVGDTTKTLQDTTESYAANLQRIHEVRHRLMNGLFPADLFGNPMIERTGWVFQRKLTPLQDVLKTSTDANIRKLIDDVVCCIHTCVRRGALGIFFSLPVDFALDQRGSIVIMGLGGITFDRHFAFGELKGKPWKRDASANYMLPETVRPYFIARMEETFTDDLLSREWGQDLKSDTDSQLHNQSLHSHKPANS
jgi:hypothetical protein